MNLRRNLAFLLVCASLASNNLVGAQSYPPPSPWQPNPGQREHLRRSLALLNLSTPADRKTVRVLFYGQSITQQAWWKEVERYLRTTYPNANLVIENRAPLADTPRSSSLKPLRPTFTRSSLIC
jgi:hypothetical protein